MRKMFLVIVDSYSKLVLLEMCSQFHIQPLKQLLTVQGLVLQLMDYHKFMPHIMDHISQVKNLNVFWKGMAFCISILLPAPPYHLTANVCAEKLVRTFKNTFRKMEGSGSLNEKLNTFSLTYRITPRSTTGISPIDFLLNRKLNSKLNLINQG